MEYTVEEVKEEYEKQLSELSSIEEKIKEVYEEELKINEILLYIEANGELNTQSLLNEQYENVDINAFNSDDKKANFENLRNGLNQINKINEYKTFIKNNNPNNLPEKEALEQKKKKCFEETKSLFSERDIKEKLIENLGQICNESVTDLQNELGKGSEIGDLIEQYAKLDSFIKEFEIYDKFLTKENKAKLEDLKQKQEEVEKQIGKNLPNVGAFISRKVQREMYAEQYKDVANKEYENEKKIKDFKNLKEEIDQSLAKIKEIPCKEMVEKLNEQKSILSGLDEIKTVNEKDMETMDEILSKLEEETKNVQKQEKEETSETTYQPENDVKAKNERINVNDLINEEQPKVTEKDMEAMDKVVDSLNKKEKVIDIPSDSVEVVEAKEQNKPTQEQISKMDEILNSLNKETKNEKQQEDNKETNENIVENNEEKSNLKPLTLNKQLKEKSKIDRERRQELEEKVVQDTKEYLHPYFSKKDMEKMQSFVDSCKGIEKKVKKKTTKENFSHRVKTTLKKIKNYFIEEEDITKREGIVSEEDLNNYLFTNQYGEAIIPEITEEKGKVK